MDEMTTTSPFTFDYVKRRRNCSLHGEQLASWIVEQSDVNEEPVDGLCYAGALREQWRDQSIADLGPWPRVVDLASLPKERFLDPHALRSFTLVDTNVPGAMHLYGPADGVRSTASVSLARALDTRYSLTDLPEPFMMARVGGHADGKNLPAIGGLSLVGQVQEQDARNEARAIDKQGWSVVGYPRLEHFTCVDKLQRNGKPHDVMDVLRVLADCKNGKAVVGQLLNAGDGLERSYGDAIVFDRPVELTLDLSKSRMGNHRRYIRTKAARAWHHVISVPPGVYLSTKEGVEFGGSDVAVRIVVDGSADLWVRAETTTMPVLGLYPLTRKQYTEAVSWLGFSVKSTDARFIKATTRCVVHAAQAMDSVGNVLVPKIIALDDPLREYYAIGKERFELERKPGEECSSFHVPADYWQTWYAYRDESCSRLEVVRGVTLSQPEASVAVPKTGHLVHLANEANSDTRFSGRLFSVRVKVCVDEYAMDGGGPSGSDGEFLDEF